MEPCDLRWSRSVLYRVKWGSLGWVGYVDNIVETISTANVCEEIFYKVAKFEN